MSDIEAYKRQLAGITDRWAESMAPVSRRLLQIDQRLATLASKTRPSPEEVSERQGLELERRNLCAEAERLSLQLRLESLALSPPTSAPDSEMRKLPAWLRTVIKDKGVDLGHGVSLSPDIKLDVKHLRPNYIGVKIRW